MSVYWLSWYEPPDGAPGNQEAPIDAWQLGRRDVDLAPRLFARLEAPSLDAAWAAAEVAYPGCRAHACGVQVYPDGWWPPSDKFPQGARA